MHCAARRTDRIEALADEIGGVATACDVTDRESVAALAERVGPVLHVLVNNAGGAFGADTVEQADPDDWARMYDVNVLGTLHVTQALLPALRAGGDGLVVNMGSTAGRVVYEGGGSYTAAKHALKALTGTLRLELSGEPIRITEVAPGMVRTDEFVAQALRRGRREGGRGVRRRAGAAHRRRHRRRRRLGRHPARARRHRRDRRPAAWRRPPSTRCTGSADESVSRAARQSAARGRARRSGAPTSDAEGRAARTSRRRSARTSRPRPVAG